MRLSANKLLNMHPSHWESVFENDPVPPWTVAVAFGGMLTDGLRPGVLINVQERESLSGSNYGDHVMEFSIGPGGKFSKDQQKPKEYLERSKVELQYAFRDVQVISACEYDVSGNPGTKLVYQHRGDTEKIHHEEAITVFASDVTFQLITESSESSAAQYKSICNYSAQYAMM